MEDYTKPSNNSKEKVSIRKLGKIDINRYYDIDIRKLDDWRFLFESILLSLLLALPIILVLVQLFYTYGYNSNVLLILMIICWLLLICMNGLSNYFQISIAKSVFVDNANIQELNSKAVLVYQLTNIWFIIFTGILVFGYYCFLVFRS